MLLSNAAIRNRTTVFVLVFGLIVAGAMSYISLPLESAPDVKIPYILITTVHPGVSPADIENTITNEIEEKLSGLKGMKEFKSTSSEGLSQIVVEFHSDVEIDNALQRVKDKVDLARPELPKNTDDPVEPVVSEINLAERPIMFISMSGGISQAKMKLIAEVLEDEIETIPGVLEVNLLGVLEREIVVEADLDRIVAYGISVDSFFRAVAGENVNQSAGGLETEGVKFNVRVPAEFDTPREFFDLPLGTRGGKPIYLSDVARVRDQFKDRTTISRLDGQTSVTLAVRKRVGANIVDIAGQVKAVLREADTLVPRGLAFEITMDESDQIRMMVRDLENNILTALVLVVVVLMIFMGIRTSLIVATVIPLSMLMSFAIIQALGMTLNMVVLFSLILALGMLVDNAIVIVENIFRHIEMGYDRMEAAMKGVAEVAWPVIASTATTLAAFTPLLFWPGIMGGFMKYLPMTVMIVLGSSLFAALVVNPVICSVFARPVSRDRRSPAERGGRFMRGYRRLLQTALAHPLTTLTLAVSLLAIIALLYFRRGGGVELFPDVDPNQGIVDIRAPQGTNIWKTNELMKTVESRLEKYRRGPGGAENYESLVATVGMSGGGGFMGPSQGSHYANLTIVFPDYVDRQRPSAEIIADMRTALNDIPGAEIKIEKQKEGPPTGDAVTVRFIGKDTKVLERLSERAKDMIRSVPNLVNLRSDLEVEKPELVFIPDRKKAARLGVSTQYVGEFLKAGIFGTKIDDYREYSEEYDIRIRLPLDQRSSINDLVRMMVTAPSGRAVPVTSLGSFAYRPGLGTIRRINRKRVVTLTADAQGRLGSAVLKDVQARLDEMDLPAGYRMEYAGEKEEEDKARAFLSRAFVLALLLIVSILVAQFNTLSVPVIIMSTVLLSMIGVFMGLLVFGMPFGIVMTGVGVISLAGVVVNNAIVLLDYTRRLQRKGLALVAAAVEAGETRLRPVLLTAVTTILGLIPMASGVSFNFHTFQIETRSESSQWWSSMAIAVIFGLGFATVLTLVVVPTMYVLSYRLANRFRMGGLLKPGAEKEKQQPVLEDY